MKFLNSVLLGLVLIIMTFSSISAQIATSNGTPYIIGTDWSPDGKFITYGAQNNVWLVPAEGGTPVNLTENLDYMCRYPLFTPDGTEVTYTRWPFNQNTKPTTLPSNFSIEAINIATGEIRVLIENANWASFNSDGAYAVYSKKIDHQKYGVYNFQTGEETVYNLEESPSLLYDWTAEAEICPDNNHFIITACADKDFIIHVSVPNIYADGEIDEVEWDNNQNKFYRVSMESGETELFDIGGYSYYFPEFSPDGTKLLCTRYDYNHYDFFPSYEVFNDYEIPEFVFIKDPETGEYIHITKENFYDVAEPQETYELQDDGNYYSLASLGKKISKKTGVWSVTREVVIYDLLTGQTQKVGDPDYFDTLYGSWSPDGTKVCYVRHEKNISYLHVFDVLQGTYKAVLSEGESSEPPTAVTEEKPVEFALMGNYPNPFNPSTTIEFSLQQTGYIQISIYNTMGQKIRDIVTDYMNPGVHSEVWNGRDDYGNVVSSGVYLCRLKMGEQVATKRMMLLK
ncbi:MAG: T9SS type A sorting domain-containing protein [Candidatus Latescibacteria bacterium]|nr:T9SS type A sorting domain-containing protein [Candidatus Latescibacterota bacterium]